MPAGSGSPLGAAVVNPFWERVSRELMERIDRVTIEDLCREAESQSLESEGRGNFDFVI